MKKRLIKPLLSLGFALMLLFGNSSAMAQGWKVKRFVSTVQLNLDGSIDVMEDITVDFFESKRGIIRQVPYLYEIPEGTEGELAEDHVPGTYYTTPISGITVDDWNFTVNKSANAYEIKVGKADEYLSGVQEYHIRYRVYEAINRFPKTQEFYWNANGNDWDVDFDYVELNVLLPDSRKLPPADVAAFTGAKGSTANASVTVIEPGKVTVTGTGSFGAHEGLTAVLRLPKNYLRHDPVPLEARADKLVIDSLFAEMTLEPGGVIDVQERLVVNVLGGDANFGRFLGKEYYGPTNPAFSPSQKVHYEVLDCWKQYGNQTETEVYDFGAGYEANSLRYELTTGTVFPETGKYVLRFHYKVYGAVTGMAGGTGVCLPWLDAEDHEPIAYAKVRLHWKGAIVPDLKLILLGSSAPPTGLVTLDEEVLQMEFAQVMEKRQKVHFGIFLPGHKTTVRPIPLHVFDPTEYYQFYDVTLDIQPSGWIHVTNKFAMYRYSWYNRLSRPVTMGYQTWSEKPYEPAMPQLWGRMGDYVVKNLVCEGELFPYDEHADHHIEIWGPKMLKYDGIDTLQYSYDIFGLLAKEGSGHRLQMSLIEYSQQSIDSAHFKVTFPGSGVLSEKDIELLVAASVGAKYSADAKLVFRPGAIEGSIPYGIVGYNQLVANLRLPDGAVSGSWMASLRLLWVNHKALFFPLFFLIPLLVAWFFVGRDRRFTTVVEFYPPEELTPTEVGMLIDDKLHNRDLLALIYYWGAQGYITIEEVYGSKGSTPIDYKFKRLKNLPSSARKYEKTIFNALFAKGDTTTVSSHKQKFHTFLTTARGQVDAYAKAKNFYVPGTLGWSSWVRFFAWVVAIIAVIGFGMVLFVASSWKVGRWEIPLGWGISAGCFFSLPRSCPAGLPSGRRSTKKSWLPGVCDACGKRQAAAAHGHQPGVLRNDLALCHRLGDCHQVGGPIW